MSLAFSPSFKARANLTMDMKLSVNAPKQKAALLGVVFITVIPYFSQYLQFIIIEHLNLSSCVIL